MASELAALKQYAIALERQNQAISKEQTTLYREIQSLNQQHQKFEQYYYQYRDASQQNTALKLQIEAKNIQISTLIAKNHSFQHLHQNDKFKEELASNKSIIQNLEASLKAMEDQKEQFIEEYLQKIMSTKASENRIKKEFQELKKKYFQQKNKNIENVVKMKEMEYECEDLRQRLQNSEVQRLQNSLQELAENYQKIELIVLQKQEKTRQMEYYINDLQYQCQILNQQFIAKYQYSQQLQYEVECMQAQLKNKGIFGGMSEDAVSMLTESISKIDLIKQHNRMVEKLASLQKQNTNKSNSRQRHSYSECGQSEYAATSPSKLQMRIQTLKMQNENLIRTLAI